MGTYFQRIGILEQALAGGGGGSPISSFRSTSFASITQDTAPFFPPDVGEVVANDTAGNVYVGNIARDVGLRDLGLTKYNADGTVAWRYTYPHIEGPTSGFGDPFFSDIACDPNGDVFGYIYDPNLSSPYLNNNVAGSFRVTLIKFSSNGDILWQKTIRDQVNGDEFLMGSLAVDNSGNAIIAFFARVSGQSIPGYNYGFNATPSVDSKNPYIAKYSPTGTLLWEKGYVSENNTGADFRGKGNMETDDAGNIYTQFVNWQQGGLVVLIKLSPSGILLWEVYRVAWDDSGQLNSSFNGDSEALGLSVTADGSTVIQGMSFSTVSYQTGLIIKVDGATGNLISNHQIGVSGNPSPDMMALIYDIKIDPATNLIYVFGAIGQDQYSFSGGDRAALICMDLNYNVQFYHEFVPSDTANTYVTTVLDNSNFYESSGPRIAIGTDNISFSFVYSDAVGYAALLVNYDLEGTSLTDGALITSGGGNTWSLDTTQTIALNSFTPLISNPFSGSPSYGALIDITAYLEVAETGVTTYGGKLTSVAPVPTTAVLYTPPAVTTVDYLVWVEDDYVGANEMNGSELTTADADGNVYTGSNSTETGTRDMMLTKFARDGTLVWRYYYPHISGAPATGADYSHRFSDIKCDSAGNVYGTCYDDVTLLQTLIKFSPNGDIIWQRTFDSGAGVNIAMLFGSITVDANDNPIIYYASRLAATVASGATSTSYRAAYIAKCSYDGALIWERGFGRIGTTNSGASFETRGDIITDPAGNVYIQGVQWQTYNTVTLKLAAADGALQWQNIYYAWDTTSGDGNGPEYIGASSESRGAAVSSDGSTIFRSYHSSDPTDSESLLLKVNAATGAIIETRRLEGPTGDLRDQILDVKIDPATDLVYVFGTVDPTASGYNNNARPYLMVLDLNFNIQWYHEYVFNPNAGGLMNITFENFQTYRSRGSRIAIGPDNVTLGFIYDDGWGRQGFTINLKKDGSTPEGQMFAFDHGDPTTITLTYTGAPTLSVNVNPSDAYNTSPTGPMEPPLSAAAGAVEDISGFISVISTTTAQYNNKIPQTIETYPPVITLL